MPARRRGFALVAALCALLPVAEAAPALLLTLDAPGWAAWRVVVPPSASVTFTTTFEGGSGMRADGGAVLRGPGAGGVAYVGVDRALPQGLTLRVAGADVLGRPAGGALPDGSSSVTLTCSSTCVSGEVVVARYAAGSFDRAALGVDLAGATVLSQTQGAGAFALRESEFNLVGSGALAKHAERVEGVPVGAFFAQGPATLRMAGPRGVESCECVLADEARGAGAYAFLAEGSGEAFLVGADVRLPSP